VKTRTGSRTINRGTNANTAIIEVEFGSGYELFIFQGSLSQFDILIKYKNGFTRIRTPKHIHWVVDVLMKYQANKTMTQDFVAEIQTLWNTITPLVDNEFLTLDKFANSINDSFVSSINGKFNALSRYGEYDIEFEYFLVAFLILQEKTNMPDAYMFSRTINELLRLNIDIFKIVSTATHNGR